MKPYEQIVQTRGQLALDAILVIYVNFYISELEIIDLCALWVPRRTRHREKLFLIEHARDEFRHADLFKLGVERFGIEWTDELLDKYRLPDIAQRFAALRATTDELELLIGLNLYAEGVLAMEELVELGTLGADLFPDFLEIANDERAHVGYGKTVLKRMLQDPAHRQRAQALCDHYRDHVQHYLWNDLGPFIEVGVQQGVLQADFKGRVLDRFEEVFTSVGLDVKWPEPRPDRALNASA